MEPTELNEAFTVVAQCVSFSTSVLSGVTDDESDLELVIQRYPMLSLALAAGSGAAFGWWLARRNQRRLPPPPPPEGWREEVRHLAGKLLSERVERVRGLLPEHTGNEAAAMAAEAAIVAREWAEGVIRRRLDEIRANSPGNGITPLLRDTIRRLDQSEDQGPADPANPE